MTLRRPSVRLFRRAAAVTVLAGAVSVVGAPAAAASVFPAQAAAERETDWVQDVRADSPDSTKAVAGIAVLVVAGVTTAVTVAPRRRRPAEG